MPPERTDSAQSEAQPRKAYLIRHAVANEIDTIIHADSAEDAMRRFDAGEGFGEWNGTDYRVRKPRVVRRVPEEDR